MVAHESVEAGLAVFSCDGKRLGRVVNIGTTVFEVASGFLFPKIHLCSFDDVHRVDAHAVHLTLTGEEILRRWRNEEQYDRLPPEPPAAPPR